MSDRRTRIVVRGGILALLGATFAGLAGGCEGATAEETRDPRGALRKSTGVDWVVASDRDTAGVRFAAPKGGGLAVASGSTIEETALAFLEAHKATFGMFAPRTELKVERIDRPDDGSLHVRFQQVANGVTVRGGAWTAHFDNGSRLTSTSGDYVVGAHAVPTVPTVGADAAVVASKNEAARRNPSIALATLENDPPQLEVVPVRGGAPVLAWSVTVSATTPTERLVLTEHVSATTGAILFVEEGNVRATATGAPAQAHPPYNVATPNVTFPISDDSPPALNGTGPGGVRMRVVTLARPNDPVVATTANPWTDATSPAGAAIAAQANANIVLEYYASHRWGPDNRPYIGFDGMNGSPVTCIINDHPTQPYNATWDWHARAMRFGDGVPGRGIFPSAAALDSVAHEMTHAVTDFTSHLRYAAGADGTESAAISESTSDIFAALITHRVRNDDGADFTYGEDTNVDRVPYRSMIQPTLDHLREGGGHGDMESFQRATREPHHDSNLPSHAFYLLTHGDTHARSRVKVPCGIGWAAADRLYWRLQTSHMQANETFRDLAYHSLAAARDLQINQMPIACAWVAVGVLTEAEARDEWSIQCERDDSDKETATQVDNALVVTPAHLVECSMPLSGPPASLMGTSSSGDDGLTTREVPDTQGCTASAGTTAPRSTAVFVGVLALLGLARRRRSAR